MRILIGEISSYKAIVIARYIRAAYPEAEIWAYDYKPIIRFIHTRYVQQCVRLPFRSLDAYIEALADYVQTQQVDVLLPVHSDHIGAILQRKKLFEHALDWVGEYEDYIQLHEKDQLIRIAVSLGVRVPETYETIKEAKVPFVVKPTNLSSAKGVRYIRTEADRASFHHSINSSLSLDIIQEYIEGQGCGYEVYCGNGKILVEYGHIRLAEWPTSGGSSVLRAGFIHPNMRPMAEKILSQVPWTGFAMFEFKLTPSNELVLIEVNPRIWGSINQALQDHSPLFEPILGPFRDNQKNIKKIEESSVTDSDSTMLTPQSTHKQTSGLLDDSSCSTNTTNSCLSDDASTKTTKNISSIPHVGVRTCLTPQVWMAMCSYALKGRWDIVRDYWRHRKNTHRDVNFWSDPLGLISMVIRKIV